MPKKDITTLEKAAADHQQAQNRLQAARDALERAESTYRATFEAVETLRQAMSSQTDEPSAEQRSKLRSLAAALTDAEVEVTISRSRVEAAIAAVKDASQALTNEEADAAELAVREAALRMAEKILALGDDNAQLEAGIQNAQRYGRTTIWSPKISQAIGWAETVIQDEAARRAPKPQPKIDPNRIVRFVRSGSDGRHRQFNAGDVCGFEPAAAAALVAQGDAVWEYPGDFPDRNMLVAAALRTINSVARALGLRNGSEVGWSTASV